MLTLRGFKSFATATSLAFETGINCIVGPNGSGKSNVVDALAWVMGEQGAKNLRGGSMADVVFAGTGSRPALGRAEVALTIDNSDGALPIDYTEVTISRTIFSSGGSEYAINGTACRLLDVQELLSDTGMGRQMHVIIGQGRLDEVLRATPEERRGFVEEAAGVLKHRRRKDRALRKLETMRGSLARIEDLAAELRRQLGPLARQAEAARKAQIIQADIRDAKARLLADDIAQQQARAQSHAVDESRLAQQRAHAVESAEAARQRLDALERQAAEANPVLASLAQRWERISALEERFRSLGELAEERRRSLSSASRPYHAEKPEDIAARAEDARRDEEELRAAVARERDALREAISAREGAEAGEHGAQRELTDLRQAAAGRREDAARLAGQIAACTGRIEALEAEEVRVGQVLEAARGRAGEASERCSALERDIVAQGEDDTGDTADHEETAAAVARAREDLEAARVRARQVGAHVASWQARAEALELSLAPEDASAWALNNARGMTGLVSDGLRVEEPWAEAVEAALDGKASALVVESLEAAVDALRGARGASAGRLHLVYGNGGSAPGEGATVDSGTTAAGGTVAADELVRQCLVDGAVAATDVVEGPQAGLLAGVALAENLDVALELLAGGAPVVATVAGDLLSQIDARGGQVSSSSILARRNAYDEAVREAEEARQAQGEADLALAEATRVHDEATGLHQQANARRAAREAKAASASAQLKVLRQTLVSANEEVERGTRRLTAIAEELTERRETLASLCRRQEAAESDPAGLEEQIEAADAAVRQARERTRLARQGETEARLTLRTEEERLGATAGRADALLRRAEALAERIRREEREARRREQAADMASHVGEWAGRALVHARRIRLDLTASRSEAEAARESRDHQLLEARRASEEAAKALRDLDDATHRQELARAQVRMRLEELERRALEELGVEADTLVEEFGPHVDVPHDGATVPYVRQEQEQRLAKAERSLTRLGKINPLALEEHAALEERQRYLAGQLADLKKSRDDLLGIIRDLDDRVERVLSSALDDVSDCFSTVFERLFPGGEGRLVVTDPESILTTGVEIEARPPGKKVKRLSLLSGGERSLTAVAFLFAIFMARPSPFYVLDEVEAALDDVNLSRLLGIFTQLRQSSQLLVITHQKRTMEIADALYGVTMREDGVSTVVSQRMQDLTDADDAGRGPGDGERGGESGRLDLGGHR